MDSPRSVTSEMSESRSRIPASIANASREELQRKLIETLKALKSRDKKLQQLAAVNEDPSKGNEKNESEGSSSSEKLRRTVDELEAARQQSKRLAGQVEELTSQNDRHDAEVQHLRKMVQEADEVQKGLQDTAAAVKASLTDERDKCQALEEQIASLKSAVSSMAQEREDAFEKIGEHKEQEAMLEDALANAQHTIRELHNRQGENTGKQQEELESYKTQVGDLEAKILNLSQEKEVVDGKVVSLNMEIDNLNSKCDAGCLEISRLTEECQKKVSDLQEELEGSIRQLEQKTEEHREASRIASRVAELENEISALKEDQESGDGTVSASYAQELEKAAEKHRNRCDDLEQEATRGAKQGSEMAKKIEELEGQLKVAKLENERLSESESLTCKELAQRLTQIEEFRRLEAQLRSDLCELEQQAHQAQAEVNDIEENLLSDRQTFETERGRWANQVQDLQETVEELSRQGELEDAEYLQQQHAQEVLGLEEERSKLDSLCTELSEELATQEVKLSEVLQTHQQEVVRLEKEKSLLEVELKEKAAKDEEEKDGMSEQVEGLASEVEELRNLVARVPELEEEVSKLQKKLTTSTKKLQAENTQLLQRVQDGAKEIQNLVAEIEEKQTQLDDEKEALETSEASLVSLKADLDKSNMDLEAKSSEIKDLKSQIAEVLERLVAQDKELGDARDGSEVEKEKMKKGLVELRKRLERANAQQRKSELEGAELRGKLEAEKESLVIEVASWKQEVDQVVNELKEYKAKAHVLLKSKESELADLRSSVEKNVEAAAHIEDLQEELDALTSEKKALQAHLEEKEANFSKHLDDLTAEFRTQLDESGAESAQYRRDCEIATEEAEQWKARALEQENLAANSWQQENGQAENASSAADIHDVQQKLDALREEHASLRVTSESMCQAKDEEISRLIHLNAELKAKALEHSRTSMGQSRSDARDTFTGDSVMTHHPEQVPDTFQFGILINNAGESASVASNSSKQELSGGIEGDDAKIFALAQRQAGRDEALSSALKENQRLEAEVLDLGMELKLREEQDIVLKDALRKADRQQLQQEGMLGHSIDMEYLKNTVLKLLETGEAETLLPVFATLLKLSEEEQTKVRTCVQAAKERHSGESADPSVGSGSFLPSLAGWGWGSM